MAEPATVETFRAAVGTIVPAAEGLPSATTIDAHLRVIELIEKARPGGPDLVAALLDAYAAQVREGARFVDLTDEERGAVFDLCAAAGVTDIRDAVDGLLVFTLSAVYSEWSRGSRDRPRAWDVLGYHGPSYGVPEYRVDV